MTGTESYNKYFDDLAKNRISKHKNKKQLEDFYYYLLSDTSYSGSYGYLGCIINFIDSSKIEDLSKIKLVNYTKYLSEIKSKSSSHRIVVYSALKKFSNFLMATGVSKENYMEYVNRPKFKESQKTKEKRENAFMTKEEVNLFINNIKASNKSNKWKSRDLAIATTLLSSGIRCSALQKLDVDSVNFENLTISVLEKGDVERVVYISDTAADSLKKWIKCRNEIVDTDEPALFISDRRKRITTKTIYNIIKSYGLVIEGKNITPHKTRATYGTQLYEKTHDLYFVQECMGHSNPKTTEIYIRGQRGVASRRAAELMGEFI